MAKYEIGDVFFTRNDVWMPRLGERIPIGAKALVVVIGVEDGSVSDALPDIRVAPLSERTDMASDEDVIIGAEESPTGSSLIAELWNARPALLRNLGKFAGSLTRNAAERLILVHNARYTNDDVPREWVGTEIEADDDSRLQFQRREFQRFAFLSQPVMDLLDCLADDHEQRPALDPSLRNPISVLLTERWIDALRLDSAFTHFAGRALARSLVYLATPAESPSHGQIEALRLLEVLFGNGVIRFTTEASFTGWRGFEMREGRLARGCVAYKWTNNETDWSKTPRVSAFTSSGAEWPADDLNLMATNCRT